MPNLRPRPRRLHTPGSRRLAVLLALLAAGLAAPSSCGGPTVPLTLTLNGIPDAVNDLLVVPPSGFTVDVGFPEPDQVVPGSLEIEILPFGGGPAVDVTGDLVVDEPDRAVALVSAELAPGSYWAFASAGGVDVGSGSRALAFAVREHPSRGPPLGELQWVQLDFAADPDADGAPDLPGDLDVVGLLADDPDLQEVVTTWATDEIVARTQAFYDAPNPSGLPDGDPVDLVFSADPPGSGAFTRICVGGADPTGNGVIGSVLFDPGNGDPSQVACNTFLPGGVFPREMLAFGGSSGFQAAFGPVMATPVGDDPLDPVVLGPAFDPTDPDQQARFQEIAVAVETFAQVVATVTAHETGHALGLVPRGAPGKGLFGGQSGILDTHNVTPEGQTPSELLLMNAGPSFSFAELAGQAPTLPRIRELSFAYLQGRLVLDPRVTGIFPPPVLDACAPETLSLSNGPYVVVQTCTGQGFVETPAIRLKGPLILPLSGENLVSSQELTATISVLQLAPGTYDVELTNGDGQVVILPEAVEVLP